MDQSSTLPAELYTTLKELGLTDLEANLYTISLKLGPTPVSTLAEHLGISRPNVYKVIEGLQNHGLASLYGKEKYARAFIVESPTVVLEKLREKRDSLGQLGNQLTGDLPDLLALYQQGGKDTKVKIVKDRDQYLKIFQQTVKETPVGGVIEFFGSASDFIAFASWSVENEWIKSRLKKQIRVKSLLLPDKDSSALKVGQEAELREVRLYHGEASFQTSYLVFGKKMVVWQPKAPLALVIEDEYITAMFKSMFYCLWEKSK